MDRQYSNSTTRTDLERMLSDITAEPKALPLSLLEEITDGFSDKREIGRGGFAVVYKGKLEEGMVVAVKKLSNTFMYEKEFHREVECLIKAKHENIVRFLGYCSDTQGQAGSYGGKFVMANVQQRLLCFEYLPGGTLDGYITGASCGLDWRSRYKIINGICQGLHYLHRNQIVHLDLKPPNILLDGNMIPKITDFGLSRQFDEKQSRAITTKIGGTMGYLAPESFGSREITYRYDIYSLGVIITEILTGKKGYHAVDNVLESWSNTLEESHRDIQLRQVRLCAEIGIECTDFNPAKRPVSTQHIIDRLHEMENTDVYTEASVTRPLTMGASSLPQHGRVETASSVKNHAVLNEPREKCSEDFLFSGSSVFLLDRTMSVLTPEAVHVAVTKIGSILENKAVAVIIAKLCQKVENLNEFPKKLEKIRNYLTTISALISQQIGSTARGTKSWIKHVRKVCHRVEDALDKYSYHVVKIQGESARSSIGSCTKYYAKVFCEIVDEVAEVEEEIQKVLQLLQASILFVPNQLIDVERLRRVVTSWDFVKDDEDLMGTEDNRLSLTRWLHSDCQNGEAVITVCGMGGLGKTALVSQVYERERRRFDAHAWIDVSKNKYPVEVLRTLLSKIGYTDHAPSAYMEAHYLSKLVKADLESRKCLIVFDDVWDIGIYHEMREAFQNLRESRIIITTRNKNVAALAPPTRQLELQPLGKADAFQLFCRRALCSSKCPGSLEKIANSIVDMCGGLPAAILSVGGMLSSKRETQHAWTEIYSQLRSELAKNDNVQAILYVSYCDLPGDIRNCFLYCSLFAEAHPIPRESLVRLWAAEGFAVGEGQITPEDVAEENLMELIRRNMLQVVETDELGNVRTCKMHGIVRDLALSVAKEEMFGSANDSGTMLFMDKETRRLSTCEWEDKGTCRVKFPRLRTIVSPATTIFSSSGMLSSILSDSRYLTVLELQDSGITEVPTSIGNLFNLQYIGLRRTRIKSIPESIEKLSNLQTLDIKQTNIEKLPIGVSKVRKLRHLLADRIENENKSEFRYFVAVQAPIELSNLEELQTLETVQASKDLTEQLKKLTKLRSVWIDNITSRDCADLFATLSNMPLLSSLLLCASDENESLRFETLRPTFTRLQRLIIRGRCTNGTLHCPVFQGRHGRYLKYLALSWCEFSEDPLLQLAPCVPNLTYLSLNRVHTTDTLVISAGCFPVLKILVLKHMPGVNQLKIEHSALPRIQGLYIMWLYKIDQVPAGIESLQTLKKLWMLGLHRDFKTHWEEKGMHQKMQHVPELRV